MNGARADPRRPPPRGHLPARARPPAGRTSRRLRAGRAAASRQLRDAADADPRLRLRAHVRARERRRLVRLPHRGALRRSPEERVDEPSIASDRVGHPAGGRCTAEPFDPKLALEVLNRHGVAFVVVGAIAAIAQGYPLNTGDLDVTPLRSRERRAARAALIARRDFAPQEPARFRSRRPARSGRRVGRDDERRSRPRVRPGRNARLRGPEARRGPGRRRACPSWWRHCAT